MKFFHRATQNHNILRLGRVRSCIGQTAPYQNAQRKDSVLSRSCCLSSAVDQGSVGIHSTPVHFLPHPIRSSSRSQHSNSRNNVEQRVLEHLLPVPPLPPKMCFIFKSIIEINLPFPIPPIIMIPLQILRIPYKEVDVF